MIPADRASLVQFDVIDAFLAQYFARHPVNATFTGVHAYDGQLPDWSRAAREDDARERIALRAGLDATNPLPQTMNAMAALRADPALLDAELARANLDVRSAEHDSNFMIDRNPALWTGEASFGAVSLMLRPFAPRAERTARLIERLDAIPAFLETMRASLAPSVPTRWTERAQRECRAARWLFDSGLEAWLALEPGDADAAASVLASAETARAAFHACAAWLADLPHAVEADSAAGEELFSILLRRGHFCERTPYELLREAIDTLESAKARLTELAREAAGSWDQVEQALAADHPTAGEYYNEFGRTWESCRKLSLEHDLVTWPEWPIRYVPIPGWAREAAPLLYWLFYRSPAPLDAYTVHDYVVTPIDTELSKGERERRLRAWNRSVIKLNHVVHHGALGHHVQNWHAANRSRSRIGKIAAVDCASRIGMFLGGSLAEGWACYATELMDEYGFLSPLERVAEQQSRVRMLARAIVDIRLHTKGLSPREAVRYYIDEVGMSPEAAEGEVTKNSMFPCTALMYWLGTQGILDLRATLQRQRGSSFRLKAFHDELLSYGSIPVPLIARLMTEETS